MKEDTLFKHKEFTVTFEETMENDEGYRKLLEPPKKLEKTPDNTRINKMCGFCHKPRHLKKCCHWNLENSNNRLKDKKKVSMNEVSP
jgi:hypothetical protein